MSISAKDIAKAIPWGHVWLFESTFTPEQQQDIYKAIAKAVNKKLVMDSYERAFIDADIDDFPSC